MTNVDELRETLEFHADQAPDGKGVVEAAQAIHRRRRRRAGVATVTAAAVLVAAVPLVVSRVAHPVRVSPVMPAARRVPGLSLNVDLLPGQSAAKVAYGKYGHTQYMIVRPHDKVPYSGDVFVFDPGTPYTDFLRQGEKVQVNGHVAYYNKTGYLTSPYHFPFDFLTEGPPVVTEPRGIVSWLDPSGAGVAVGHANSLDALLALAENVRIGVPSRVVAPYHLSYLPPGIQLTTAQTRNSDPRDTESDLIFSLTPLSAGEAEFGFVKPPLLIKTLNRTPAVDAYQKGTPPTLKIAGHDAWWYTNNQPGRYTFLVRNSGALVVNAGNCQMRIMVAGVERFSFDELKRTVEGARFKDCAKPSTWVQPLG
jgi:hypothetical protein